MLNRDWLGRGRKFFGFSGRVDWKRLERGSTMVCLPVAGYHTHQHPTNDASIHEVFLLSIFDWTGMP